MLYPKDKIIQEKEYYSLVFAASPDGKIYLGGFSEWVDFADKECKIELREFSIVVAERMAHFWKKFKKPFCVVNDIEDFIKWYVTGGNALVIEYIAKEMFPDSMKPLPSLRLGNKGFNSINILPKTISKKVPSPKIRMDILKRDNFRCRICGRSPDDNVDIQLDVHHILPYAKGGLTHEENLITLCHTCHNGLDPHYEWSLYSLLDDTRTDRISKERKKYLMEVEYYRNVRKKEFKI